MYDITSGSGLGQAENPLHLVDGTVDVGDDGELELVAAQSLAVQPQIGNVKPIAAQEGHLCRAIRSVIDYYDQTSVLNGQSLQITGHFVQEGDGCNQ